MKGLYVYYGTGSVGVIKKIDMQLKELRTIADVDLIKVSYSKRTIWKKIKSEMPFFDCGFDYAPLYNYLNDNSVDFIYIRRTTADSAYYSFLKYIKKINPMCKVLIEIYTYPYDIDDYKRNLRHSLVMYPYYMRDKYYRTRLSGLVDRFVTYSDDDYIYGIKTIKTCNGVNVDEIKPLINRDDVDNSNLNLIAVAGMQVHHGYERLIRGLHEYNQKAENRKVVFHMVGEGPEIDYYRRLVAKFKLHNTVLFYGKRIGEELDEVYEKADIAIGSLGLYKYNIYCNSTLKSGEYLAKGLPIISGCKISTIEKENNRFIYEVANDSSTVDVQKIVDFYDDLYSDYNRVEIRKDIRDYAKTKFDMPVVMGPIVEYILNYSQASKCDF